MHNRDISKEQMVVIQHWTFYHNIFVTLGISLVKISVACFLVRLVPQKAYKIFLYCMIGKLWFTILSTPRSSRFPRDTHEANVVHGQLS
jgi:FtsH-binding integral membrane protein